MKINQDMNLVIGIEHAGGTAYVHSMPVGRAVFEQYYLVIAKTFAAIYAEGLNQMAGPRVAALMLKQVATDMGQWDGETGVNRGLMAEIRRLTNVIVPGERGWTTIPLQEAVDRIILDSEDVSEVENAIVFFTVVSSMHHRSIRKPILEGAASMWGAEIVSSNSTDFAASLKTLTAPESSKATRSSLPS